MLSAGSCSRISRQFSRLSYHRLRSYVTPRLLLTSLSSRNVSVLSPDHLQVEDNASGAESNLEKGQERPEHAVISTFDLFSIGGECLQFSRPKVCLTVNSRPEQFTYSWSNACGKDIHQRLTRAGLTREGQCRPFCLGDPVF